MPDGWENSLSLLPPGLKEAARAGESQWKEAEELRLRRGREPTVLLGGRERVFCRGYKVGAEDLAQVMEKASGASYHAVSRQLSQGFLCAAGGVRVGVCGTAGAAIDGMRDISSLSLRIPRQIKTAGAPLTEELSAADRSVLILSPPGGGKTTFLRELIRLSSQRGRRVGLCDERGEVAALFRGEPGFDLGCCTDVLSGVSKAQGALMLLRSMNPEIIAVDEITAEEDLLAMETVANCGVKLYATAHAAALEDLRSRPLYRRMLAAGIFDTAVLIERRAGARHYRRLEL